MSRNLVILEGNLTRDPELKVLASGQQVCNLGVATNRKYKKDDQMIEEVEFSDVVVWGKTAENCAKYLSKGQSVSVEGRLKTDTWETDSGEKRSKTRIVARDVQFGAGGKKKEDGEERGDDADRVAEIEPKVKF